MSVTAEDLQDQIDRIKNELSNMDNLRAELFRLETQLKHAKANDGRTSLLNMTFEGKMFFVPGVDLKGNISELLPTHLAMEDISLSKGTFLFNSPDECANYMTALGIMLDLRRCEGSETPMDRVKQWSVTLRDDHLVSGYASYIESKHGAIVPWFKSEDLLQQAVENVGKYGIIHMIKTLHGLKD